MRFTLVRRCAACALGVALLAAGGSAGAHHSFAVHFTGEKIISVSGVVTAFSFRNPHGMLMLEAVDANGVASQWSIETNSPNILRRRGWSPDSIKPGDQVTVEGYPARDGSNSMRVYRVLYADGRELTGQRPAVGVADGQD
jgi:hypothetical protein